MSIYSKHIFERLTKDKAEGRKRLAVLLDPDKLRLSSMSQIIEYAKVSGVDYFFIGGSLIVNDMLDQTIVAIKEACDIPVVLFPGNSYQLSFRADAILFLSLISGRNPELLIGNHVLAAPFLKVSGLEILPTGYLLIDGGVETTVSYISNTKPIPRTKPDIAMSTALAGEMLGLKLIYMDAGSGAASTVPLEMIQAVSAHIQAPLIVGGGIRSAAAAEEILTAGADIIVVGNAIEKDPELVQSMAQVVHQFNQKR